MDSSEPNTISRRRMLAMAGMSAGAALLAGHPLMASEADVMTAAKNTAGSRNTSFGQLKQINAGALNVGYAEAGPANGKAVILLHGWPYDIYSFVDVAPLLASAGYRVIIPYLRGYGSTRFLSKDTVRNGQQSAVAIDAIALMDALKIEKAVIGGF